MRYYTALRNQVFSIGEYKIVPIRNEDRFDIMKWRNDQIYHLRQSKILTKDDQTKYFKNIIDELFVVDNPTQLLFSFLYNGNCIGYGGLVHIDWKKQNAEISFIMDTDLEIFFFKKYWVKFLSLIEQVAFNDLNFKKIFIYAYDVRKHLYPILIENNYTLTERIKNNYKFNNKGLDALIYSKNNTL